ncbi:DivIVA domain-containing protein [Chryseotalea sanaruensis]|uniref:DivIVA domain-containing protein n=1 Tax=Chryseotalea sanaruensis TaxID=2482724 RepID=A0A401UAK3_9BACT|nr:DivIVA domain-containing protein [Chryseotalea sanaruensis]GCC51915.1 DivIVA domain-containing protein [Chryseotalea sanaruensis]
MRVTPLDIRQKSFEKNFRGYDKDEVNAFLLTLSQEWQRTLDEVKEMKLKLEGAEKEVAKLREVESSLYKTLKTAEDTGANVIEQARQAADLHLRESNMRAEAMLSEAKSKAKDTIEESDMKAKEILAEMEDRLKLMVENYKRLETSREDLMADMKRIANDAIERVERARAQTKSFDADQHLKVVRSQLKKQNVPMAETKPEIISQEVKETLIHKEVVVEQSTVSMAGAKPVFKSFFDEIG